MDNGYGIAVDSLGNAYVTGQTISTDFPTTNPLQPANGGGGGDAFVAKLNPVGSALVYSTYLGGSGVDEGYGIAVDSLGNAYVTGYTNSSDFPTTNPLQRYLAGIGNAFVAKLNPTGSALVYSTYLGGSGLDYGYGIAVNSSGNAYVMGTTISSDFPTVNPLPPIHGGGNDAFVAEIIPPENQTITFGALANQSYGTPPFTVSATASSGLMVSFNSQTISVCTVSGTTVTLVAVGTCTIQATQGGNATYSAATSVNQTFQVTQESQTITFGALSNQSYGTPPFTVSATASSGLMVSFNSQTISVCTVSGTTVTLVAVGTCTIQATQGGNATYPAALPVNQSFQVTQGSQTITFGAIPSQALSTPPFMVSATSSSGLTVSFNSRTPLVCTVSGNTVTLVITGICTIQATQAGNTNYKAAPPVDESFQVTP